MSQQLKSKTEKEKVDVHTTSSSKVGVKGFIETVLRKHKVMGMSLFVLPIISAYMASVSLSLLPGVILGKIIWEGIHDRGIMVQSLGISFILGLVFFTTLISALFVIPFFNWLLLKFSGPVKPIRVIGYSLDTIPWYYHNAMTQLARYTVLDFLTTTPLIIMFYKLMGMKIGKGVVINTTNISDPCLITLDDHVILGGSATLFAHYGMHGYLIVCSTHIKKGTTIGLKASVMGDVIVGKNQTIAPGTVLLPKTRIPDKEK
jgi:hypothetical protein